MRRFRLRLPVRFLGEVGSSLQAAGRPLVRLPTDRHTATGTCEIGHYRNNIFARCAREFSTSREKLSTFSRSTTRAHPRVVNGSMRCAARMNCTRTARPQSTNTTSSTRAPKLPRSNNVAMAHEPANAAPNTSAPIRTAALTTVVTLSQLMRRLWPWSSSCEAQCRRNPLIDQVHRAGATAGLEK